MDNLFSKTQAYVQQQFSSADPSGLTFTHLQRTAYWVQQLDPDASDALRIAAVSHDIERAVRQQDMHDLLKKSADGFGNATFLHNHQTRGAEIMRTFLTEQGASQDILNRVGYLIEHHEDGGDAEANVLKDADTISFFENNVERFVTKHATEQGKEKVRAKFQWMYDRLTDPRAREIVKPWFDTAMKRL